jgi:hypothetical protein
VVWFDRLTASTTIFGPRSAGPWSTTPNSMRAAGGVTWYSGACADTAEGRHWLDSPFREARRCSARARAEALRGAAPGVSQWCVRSRSGSRARRTRAVSMLGDQARIANHQPDRHDDVGAW